MRIPAAIVVTIAMPISSLLAQVASQPAKRNPLVELSGEIRSLSRKVAPAVVQVVVSGYGPLDQSTGHPVSLFGRQNSIGSGVIVDPLGYVVTNAHVISGAVSIKVAFGSASQNGVADIDAELETVEAKIVGVDTESDLAVLKIERTGLPALKFANSDRLRQGDLVLALGAPIGLPNSMSLGVVSAPARSLGEDNPMVYVQTDASINPGNSGGPLINMKGEVVGINTAIIADGQGIGFAIPINMAKEIVPQLEEKGHVTRGWLGVSIQEMTPELAKSLGLKEKKGALVAQVISGGPAEKAGIEQGDVIVEFDGKEIVDSKDLPHTVASKPVGKSVTVKVSRNGKVIERQVKLGEMEEKGVEVSKAPSSHKSLGIAVQNVTPEIAKGLGLKKEAGVVVARVEPGSPAADAGIQRGDVIQEINRKPVKDVEDFVHKVEQSKGKESILLFIQRGQNNLFAAVTPK